MGVVNVTPDSFSDGGDFLDPDDAAGAAAHGRGGSGHRRRRRRVDAPGSAGVTVDEELRRVVPVFERLDGEVPLSIDTAKAEVARRALALGAELVNDVTALRGDPELAGVVADAGCYVC
jgi:dihydropteroate synthase